MEVLVMLGVVALMLAVAVLSGAVNTLLWKHVWRRQQDVASELPDAMSAVSGIQNAGVVKIEIDGSEGSGR